jgi:hypothetical protein
MREVVHSTLDLHHDDDLSIVASDDEEQSMDGHSLSAGASDPKVPKTAPLDLVRRETRAAMICRYILLILMVVSGSLISLGTHRWVSDAQLYDATSENSCFWDGQELQSGYAQSLERNLMHGLQARFMASFTVSASFTSFVLAGKGQDGAPEWPTVTIPQFDAQLTGILGTSPYGAYQVLLAPMVVGALKTTFEEYAVAEQLEECSTCTPIPEIIKPVYLDEDGTTVPIWQIAPFTTEPIKLLNLLSDPIMSTAIQHMEALKAGVLSDIVATTLTEDKASVVDDGPTVSLFYPVFQDFQQVKMSAALSIIYPWHHLLEEALPFALPTSNSDRDSTYFSLLLESCTGKVEAFNIIGRNVTYRGSVATITDSFKEESETFAVPGGYTYGSSVPLQVNKDVCNYNVWLVPTETGREFLSTIGSVSNTEEESDKAVLYTALVASVFFLLLSCFLVYDWLMEKRQSVVSNIATKSSAIVENLFPAQVRDRMLQGVKHGQQRDDQEKPIENGISKNSLPAVPGGAPGPVSVKQFLSNDDGMNNNISGQPIADLFPNTTVLFADIAGFTAWSSQRDPPQVFTLLETLYRSFDVIAKKLKVFKGSYLVCREVTPVISGL